MDILISTANFLFASVICVMAILGTMKLLKFIWKHLIKKPIKGIINFFKPELRDIFSFCKWVASYFKQSKEA